MENSKQHYFVCIIAVLSALFYFWTRFWRFSEGFICPTFEFDSFSDFGLYMVLIAAFVTAFIIGKENKRYKWLFPTFMSAFMWLIPAFMYWLLNPRMDYYSFMYYMVYAFFFLFLGIQIVASLGLVAGVIVFKHRMRTRQRDDMD